MLISKTLTDYLILIRTSTQDPLHNPVIWYRHYSLVQILTKNICTLIFSFQFIHQRQACRLYPFTTLNFLSDRPPCYPFWGVRRGRRQKRRVWLGCRSVFIFTIWRRGQGRMVEAQTSYRSRADVVAAGLYPLHVKSGFVSLYIQSQRRLQERSSRKLKYVRVLQVPATVVTNTYVCRLPRIDTLSPAGLMLAQALTKQKQNPDPLFLLDRQE